MEIEKINNTELSVKVYQGQRVVTFKDIDTVHERPEGTAKRNFSTNKKHFIEGEDFFTISKKEVGTDFVQTYGFNETAPSGMIITESGYLMLVKSFIDDLAWDVQRKLVKSYFRKSQAHNVKQLTITSRDIATMTTGKNLHGKVVRNIIDCIEELSEMGFNTGELFIEDTYIGANKQENTQYLCTEKGCNCYANKLEPEARQKFISEFTERFENMRCIAEGKPVKKMPKLIGMSDVQEKEPLIRLFQTDRGGVVLLDDNVYELDPDEMGMLNRFIPEMEKGNIGQVQYAVTAFLRSMRGFGKLEEIASWGVKEKEPQQSLLPDKSTQKPKRTSSRDDNAPFITFEQAKNRYNMGFTKITRLAKESGALIRYGKSVRYDRVKMDAYLAKEYSE